MNKLAENDAWLRYKRKCDLNHEIAVLMAEGQKALDEYSDLIDKMIDEEDLDKKLELIKLSKEAFKRYDEAEKRYAPLVKELTDILMGREEEDGRT